MQLETNNKKNLFENRLYVEKEYYKGKKDIEEGMREKTKQTQRT